MSARSNPDRPNPAGEAALAAQGVHKRTMPVEVGDAIYAVSCRCGWWEGDLTSKRKAHKAMTAHLEDSGSLADDLNSSEGRGRIASRARDRALDLLITRHAAELAELEEAERVKLGLTPNITVERSA